MKKGRYRKGVSIVTYLLEDNKVYYLLLKRKKHWKGWEFPKGGVEKNESSIEAAKREAREETGQVPIKIRSFRFSGKYKYDKELPDRPGIIGQTYKLYSAQIGDRKIRFDDREESGYKWLLFDKAFSLLKWPDQKVCLNIVNNHLTKRS